MPKLKKYDLVGVSTHEANRKLRFTLISMLRKFEKKYVFIEKETHMLISLA